MRTLPVICVMLLLIGCGEMPNEADSAPDLLDLTIVSGVEQIWSGDSVRFTAVPESPPPPGSEYYWTIDLRTTYMSKILGDVIRTADSSITLYFPDWESDGPIYPYGHRLHLLLTVRILTRGIQNRDYTDDEQKQDVYLTTRKLTITPDTAFWDTDVALPYTASYGGRMPEEGYIEWSFGDGETEISPNKTTVNHTYMAPGEYTVSAKLKQPGSDTALASSEPAFVAIDQQKPGRFVTLTITGLKRTFTVTTISVDGIKGTHTEEFTDPLVVQNYHYLHWDRELFLHASRDSYTLRCIDTCNGILNGTGIDSVRLYCRTTYSKALAPPGLLMARFQLTIRDLPRVSEHRWEVRGRDACSAVLSYFTESATWVDTRWQTRRKSEWYTLESYYFLENAQVTITIDHNFPE